MPPKSNRVQTSKPHIASAPKPQPNTLIAQTKFHSGPLPAPHDLAHYDQILPGAANRILAMAEAQVSHRMECENKELQADIEIRQDLHRSEHSKMKLLHFVQAFGQLLGTIVSLTSLGLAAYTAIRGAPALVSVAFLGLPVVAMINAVTGNKKASGNK